ncbi:MAG: DUF896 domain-containing protein [Lachnospiraceae bacterium]|nr:DUF896 domain-containing protein [Lachnospiraceae bacterium]
MAITQEMINRINELYHKSQAEGLTAEELEEQKKLRRAYIDAVKGNISSLMYTVDTVNEDGSITNAGEEHAARMKKKQ